MERLVGRRRLIRVKTFDGHALTFVPNSDMLSLETLPLAEPYHEVAKRLRVDKLCWATIVDDLIIELVPTR